jgi:hypothetical protein
VLWKITKGSFLNKVIILPITFLLSAFLPAAITPILLVGGVYLAYEGVEKIYEYLFHRGEKKHSIVVKKMTAAEVLEQEKTKIKSAIIVDFILSAEIVIIALGTVIERPLNIQIAVVTVIATLATIGVYGFVALLVRMDDLGYRLIKSADNKASFSKSVGTGLVKTLPVIIRGLAIIGTIAMILVAGGIFVHNIHFIHNLFESLPSILGEFIVGLLVGGAALIVVKIVSKITKAKG